MGPDETSVAAPDAQPTADIPTTVQPPAAPPAAAAMTGQPTAPAPAAPPQPQPMSPEAQVVAHQSRLGKIAMAAMGKDVSYVGDPQTGKITPVVQQRSFSDFARNLVGGLLMGGAMGQEAAAAHGGSPLAGFLAGANGAVQRNQQQDQQARAQAVQQMKQQQDAQKDQQDQQESVDRDALAKAQIAHSNLTTLQLNQTMQRQGYEDHARLAQAGKANVQPFVDAGLKPIFENIPESKMQETIQNYPGASALDWTHTGVMDASDLSKATGLDVEQTGEHQVQGPDGQTHWESTFTAFDPKGEVPLSGQTLTQWKQDGFLDTLGANGKDVLKPDMPIPANQYIALKNAHEKFQLQTEQTRQQKQKVAMDAADLAAKQALAHQRTASGDVNEAKADGTIPTGPRQKRASQTQQVADAAETASPDGKGGDQVSRAGDNILAGYSTLDDAGRGMGKEAAEFRRKVQDYILQKSPENHYDFEAQAAESKEFRSVPVRAKLAANETLTGKDGKSGLLEDLSKAAHEAGLTQFPPLNDVQAWARIESGGKKGIKVHQLARDVAEQYGTIFAQGGATSDVKIKLGQENFPEKFNAGQTDEAVEAARIALGDKMRVLADHNRFIRSHYGASIPVRVQNDKGRTGTTTMDKVDNLLAQNKNWKRLN